MGNYVEPFAGSLAVLLARPHRPRVETVNDRDCYLANFWRAVHRDPEKVAHYADWPVNEADLHARHKWLCNRPTFRERMLADPYYFDARIAGWWVWGLSQWIGAGWCSRPDWTGGGGKSRGNPAWDISPHLSSRMGIHNLDGRAKRPVINRGSRGVLHAPGTGDGRLPKSTARTFALTTWMLALAQRLRDARVCCGDWRRIVTPSCTWKMGGGQLTAVFLDPPYTHSMRDAKLYAIEQDVAADVRAWAVKNQANPNLRIALCGLDGEHDLPGWEMARWKAPRGYAKGAPRTEVIWFSPHCLKTQDLFSGHNGAIACA